jgi:hypothetical protein
MAGKDGHWMERAFSKNKGKFSRKAKRAGMSTAEYARKESGAPGKLGKEARLAKIGMKSGKRKKHGRSRSRS